jgi:hypothetical protein
MNRFSVRSRRVLWMLVLAASGLAQPAAAQIRGACGIYALCLGGDRFQIAAAWKDPVTGDQNVARAVTLTPDSGYFWFFEKDNIEITVKTLDGCTSNGFEWVFASGMTNVEVSLDVTDVLTGDHKRYLNPAGTAFVAIQDTGAFANCPGPAAGEIAGSWTGTFESADIVDCDSNTPAQATFERDGANVTGTLQATENACGFSSVHFAGTLEGDQISGDLTGGGFVKARAFGVISGSTLELVLANGFGFIPGGTMHLRR